MVCIYYIRFILGWNLTKSDINRDGEKQFENNLYTKWIYRLSVFLFDFPWLNATNIRDCVRTQIWWGLDWILKWNPSRVWNALHICRRNHCYFIIIYAKVFWRRWIFILIIHIYNPGHNASKEIIKYMLLWVVFSVKSNCMQMVRVYRKANCVFGRHCGYIERAREWNWFNLSGFEVHFWLDLGCAIWWTRTNEICLGFETYFYINISLISYKKYHKSANCYTKSNDPSIA